MLQLYLKLYNNLYNKVSQFYNDKLLSKKNVFITIATVIIFVIIIYFFKNNKNHNELPPQNYQQSKVEVDVIQVKKENILYSDPFTSYITAKEIYNVIPQVEGIIIEKYFQDSSYVNKGDKLFLIDPFERIIIRSPIDGFITRSFFEVGSLVQKNQQQSLAIVTNIDQVYADIQIPADLYPDFKEKKLNFTINYNNNKINSDKYYFDKFVDGTSDSINLRVKFDNKNHALLQNMFVNININYAIENIILLPQKTINFQPNGEKFVWIVDKDNKVKKRIVNSDKIHEGKFVVYNELNDNEIVIYEGSQKVAEDAEVMPKLIIIE